MAHQKFTVFNPSGFAPKFSYEQYDQEPTNIDYSCHLADDSATKIVLDVPGKYGAANNKTLELTRPKLKIFIYFNPSNPQSSIHFCADIWQNGVKVLTRCTLLASVIPMNAPGSHQTFIMKDDKGELIDFKQRFAHDKYNLASFTMKPAISSTGLADLYSDGKLDFDDENKSNTELRRPSILRRPIPYSQARTISDVDLQEATELKRKASTILNMFPKKPTLTAITPEAQADGLKVKNSPK